MATSNTPSSTDISSNQDQSAVHTEKGSQENSSGVAGVDEAPARSIHGVKWFLVCLSLYIAAFLYGLDTTIAADVQASVIGDFGDAAVQKLTWIGTGYPLGSVATIFVYGALFNKFNMKWVFVVAFLIFEVGSAVCGAAPDMNALIVGRVVCGLGGSGLYLGALSILSLTTITKERGTYLAGFGTVWGVGSILGPVVGGAFSSSSATWRWAFYINLVVGVICVPIYLFYLPAIRPAPGQNIRQKLSSIDWVGLVLSAGIVTAFTLVLTFAGAAWPWKDGRTIAVFVILGAQVMFFVAQQKFCLFTTKEQRTYPVHLLHSRSQILLYIGTSAAVTNLFVPTYYIPLYFQFVNNDTAIKAAVRLLPFIVLLITSNMLSGLLLPKLGYYMPMYLVSGILMTIGGALMFTVESATPAANIYGYSVLIAIGSGLTVQSGYSIATVKVAQSGNPQDTQNAVTLQNISQLGSTLICLVISGQVFQSGAFRSLNGLLSNSGFTRSEIQAAVSGSHSTVFLEIEGELRRQVIDAIAQALSKVYALSLSAGAVMVVVSVFMKRERLFGIETSPGA